MLFHFAFRWHIKNAHSAVAWKCSLVLLLLPGLADVRIEGIDAIALRYKTMVDTFKKKSYDLLDHRKQDFDNDYVDFRTQIDSLQLSLQGFMDSWFTRNLSVSYVAEWSRVCDSDPKTWYFLCMTLWSKRQILWQNNYFMLLFSICLPLPIKETAPSRVIIFNIYCGYNFYVAWWPDQQCWHFFQNLQRKQIKKYLIRLSFDITCGITWYCANWSVTATHNWKNPVKTTIKI